MNNLSFEIQPSSNKNLAFIVRSTHPKKQPPAKFYCVALNEEEGREWKTQFEKILDGQKMFMRALTSPIEYQNNLKKSSSLDEKYRKTNNDDKSSDRNKLK